MAIELFNSTLFSDANLQGYWRLESDCSDSGPNGYNLTEVSTPGHATGMFGNGLDCEASTPSYASLADASCANLEISGSQTWGFWFKPESIGIFHAPMDKGGAANAHGILILNTNYPYFQLTGLTTNPNVTHTTAVSAGTWYFICGVYDSANSKLKIWVNDTKVEVTASGTASDTNGVFYLGQDSGGTDCDGIIDDAFIFNRALTDAEVTARYNGTDALVSGTFLAFL